LLLLGTLASCAPTAQVDEEVESEVEEIVEEPIETVEVRETEFRLEPAEITLDRPGTYVLEP
jgi:hypothetical protein